MFVAKRAGVNEANAKQLEVQVEQHKEAAKIDQSVRTAPDSDVDKRLQSYYRD